MTSGAFVHLTGLLEAGQAAEAQCYPALALRQRWRPVEGTS
jgi:hypothetical protein